MRKLIYLSVFAFALGACSSGSQKSAEEATDEATEQVEDAAEDMEEAVEESMEELDTLASDSIS